MTCQHCVQQITRAMQALAADATVRIDLAARTAAIAGSLTAEQVVATLADEGYPARVLQESEPAPQTSCCGTCRS